MADAPDQETLDPQSTDDAKNPPEASEKRLRLRMDRREMKSSYVNAFQQNATAEEVIVEVGLNQVVSTGVREGQDGATGEVAGELMFEVSNRLVMTHQTTKRLAIALSQIVRQYESRFGELKVGGASPESKKASPAE